MALAGREPPDGAPWKYLKEDQIQFLQQGLKFTFTADFTPAGQDDSGWRGASQVAFKPGVVGAARWHAEVERKQGKTNCAWLALLTAEPDDPIDVAVERGADQIAWCFVQSRAGWRYLRVIPRTGQQAADFTLRVSCPIVQGHEVVFPKRPLATTRFPF